MVLDTSRGIISMMRKEKYQVMRTARVTSTGCLIQLEYLHSKTAERRNATQTSVMNTEYAML